MVQEKTIRQILSEKDEVTLVDLEGKNIGFDDKYEAHKYPSKRHLAVSVWLFNSKGQVLFQKRSQKKIVGATWWANSACGNVWPTETFFDCVNRRLKVELGIVGVGLQPVYKFSYKAYGNETYGEHETDQVYVGLYEEEIKPNPEEVSEILWLDFKDLFSQVSVLEYISAEESLLLNDQELKEKTQPVVLKSGEQELLVAPWTIFMLKNSNLFDAFKKTLSPIPSEIA